MNTWLADAVEYVLDFSNILNTSITASWAALAVIVLRLFLKKAPKWTHAALWGLVAVRLLLPFSIESEFSLIPSTETVPQEILGYQGVKLSEPAHIDVVSNPIFSGDVTIELEQTVDRVQIQMMFMTLYWLAGIGVMFVYLAVSYIRIYCRIRNAKQFGDNIYTSENVASPFVFGVIRPRICLPENMDAVSMSYVIAHEEAHIRRRDHWYKPLGFLLLTIHWFNPVMWLSYILLCRDIELACDERVVKEFDDAQRADYSEALLECSVKHRTLIFACPLAFGEVGVKQRIKSVLNYKKPAFWIVVLAVAVCAAAAVCFLTNPINKNVISIEEHDWYFERAYSENREKEYYFEEYQPGLQPKTENSVSMNAILVPDGEPMWYQFVTGDWDTERIGLHFIPEETDSRTARYTVELYRDTGELFQGADAVMEPMTDGDGYVLTVYCTSDGYENLLIFTTEKQPGAVQGEKKLTIDDVLTLSQKQMALTWEDFAEYTYTDEGTWNFRCIYEIDEIFWLEITGGSMYGTPMQINLCAKADYGDGAEYIDIRRRYADEYIVENFIKEHGHHISLSLDGIPEPVEEYQSDIRIQAAKSIFGADTVYASGIDKLEKISTGTVGLSEEILLYRLDYWITKGINGLTGTPPEDIWRESVYFAMFHDWTSDTWTRLGELSEEELDKRYNTAEMIEKYGNKFIATAAEMGHEYIGDMEEASVMISPENSSTAHSGERLFGLYISYYVDLAWNAALPIAESENITIDREYYNLRHDYDGRTIWIQFYGITETGWDDRYVDITIVRNGEGVYRVDPAGCIIGVNSENIRNATRNVIGNYVGNIESVRKVNSSNLDIRETNYYKRIMNYDSEQILDYVFTEFLQGEQTDLHGFVLQQLMTDLLNENEMISYDAENGQDYFDHWLESARSVGEQHDAEWLRENVPAIAIVLTLIES